MIKRRQPLLYFFLLFFTSISVFGMQEEENNISNKTSFWYTLIDLEEKDVLKKLVGIYGSTPIEISSREIGSKADKILWFKNGPTLWFSSGKLVQLRLPTNIQGYNKGLFSDCSQEDARRILGEPWIERENSLYYNLPWRGGPVRLRLIFKNEHLVEAYIFNLNHQTSNNK